MPFNLCSLFCALRVPHNVCAPFSSCIYSLFFVYSMNCHHHHVVELHHPPSIYRHHLGWTTTNNTNKNRNNHFLEIGQTGIDQCGYRTGYGCYHYWCLCQCKLGLEPRSLLQNAVPRSIKCNRRTIATNKYTRSTQIVYTVECAIGHVTTWLWCRYVSLHHT